MSMQSEQINELATALSKAQGEITGAVKDSKNPFFKSAYADLASCWDACRLQLAKNNLSVTQPTICRDGQVYVVTTLMHGSGQWIRGELPVKAKDDGPQAQGSGITYARRYALAAIVGIAQIDDDAEAAQARTGSHKAEPQYLLADLQKIAQEFRDALDAEDDQLIYNVHVRSNKDQEQYGEASKLLDSKERSAIKAAIARQKIVAGRAA